jgi:LPXTG-motif cell wall-anchored protein
MTDALSAMEYPHWMMVAGAVLVALGFIGLVFRRNRNGPANESSRARESTPTNG